MLHRWAVLLPVLFYCLPASSQEFRILSHEQISGFISSGGVRRPDPNVDDFGSPRISFDGFGRRFDLELERNFGLVRELSPERVSDLDDFRIYRGQLAGIPGSWVRVSLRDGKVSGVIWDGADLYAIEPLEHVQELLVSPYDPDSGQVLYRLSETVGSLRDFVVSLPATTVAPAVGKPSSNETLIQVVGAPLSPAQQLSMGLIADSEFFSYWGASHAANQMLEIANIVDGIFFWQVGLHVVVGELEVFAEEPDPFSASNPVALLEEVAGFKGGNPAFADQGVAQLFTRRFLEGGPGFDTIGIAYLDSICHPSMAVGVTKAAFSQLENALIAAHELAHNLGSPHDGEEGSPCQNAPERLMAPFFSSSDTFSQCSIDQMIPVITAASCIGPLAPNDVQVRIEAPTLVREFELFGARVWIDNLGSNDALDVRFDFDPGDWSIDSWSHPGCVLSAGLVTCTIDSIPSGQSTWARIDVQTVRGDAETTTLTATVTAANDFDVSNNTATNVVGTLPNVNLDLFIDSDVVSPGTLIRLRPGETTDVTVEITNSGIDAAEFLDLELIYEPDLVPNLETVLEIVQVVPDSGACGPGSALDLGAYLCSLGGIEPGETRSVDVTVRGLDPGFNTQDPFLWEQNQLYAISTAQEAGIEVSWEQNTRFFAVAQAFSDIYLEYTASDQVAIGGIGEIRAEVFNDGPDSSALSGVWLSIPPAFSVTSFSANPGSCSLQTPQMLECQGPIASGDSMIIDVTVTPSEIGSFDFLIYADSFDYDSNQQNDGFFPFTINAVPGMPVVSNQNNVLLGMPDLNGNGYSDIGVLLREPIVGRNFVYVIDGGSGALLETVVFGPELAQDAVLVSDVTGDQVPEPAVLVEGFARVKDPTNGAILGRPPFDPAYIPFGFLSVGDVNGDTVPDLAVVGQEAGTGRVRAQVKAAVSQGVVTAGDLVSRVNFDMAFDPLGAVVVDDIGDSPANEIAVLGVDSSGRVRAQVKDAYSGVVISRVYFDRNFAPLAFAVLPDPNDNLTYLGVLGRSQDGLIRAQIKRASDGALIGLVQFDSAYEPRAFFGVPDSNDSGSGGEVAVLGINDSGIVRAQVKKISDATPVSIIRFDSNYPPIDAIVVNGTAGTGRTEIAVIGANATNQYQLQIKDLMTGDPVRVGLVP